MRATSKLLALALMAALQPAVADVLLDFEDIPSTPDFGMIQLGDRYKISKGVQFTGGAWGARSFQCDGISGFIPLDGGCNALQLAGNPLDGKVDPSASFTLNFKAGFITGSSFYYSALPGSNVSIALFDDLDGKGQATRITGLTTAACDASGPQFCTWSLQNLSFSGVARSIVVTGKDESLLLDNVKLVTASTSPGKLPEPGSIALAFGALGALGWVRRRGAR